MLKVETSDILLLWMDFRDQEPSEMRPAKKNKLHDSPISDFEDAAIAADDDGNEKFLMEVFVLVQLFPESRCIFF